MSKINKEDHIMDKKQAISMDGVMNMHTVLCQKS